MRMLLSFFRHSSVSLIGQPSNIRVAANRGNPTFPEQTEASKHKVPAVGGSGLDRRWS